MRLVIRAQLPAVGVLAPFRPIVLVPLLCPLLNAPNPGPVPLGQLAPTALRPGPAPTTTVVAPQPTNLQLPKVVPSPHPAAPRTGPVPLGRLVQSLRLKPGSALI